MDPNAMALRLEPGGPSWPAEWVELPQAPDQVWVRGDPGLLGGGPRVAMVGSRAPTPYGELQATRFARALAAAGVTVVSGMARGIDSIAHSAALDHPGPTIGVLGCGVDRPWPGGALAERMAKEALLLSEFPLGTPPRRHHFPLRNRLISGLSHAVLVIEAAQASGSLITARWASDQGRTVYALPGRVDHPLSRGCHGLIREGAQLVEDPDEILMELSSMGLGTHPSEGTPGDRDPQDATTFTPPAGARAALWSALEGETLSAEELANRCQRSLGPVLGELVELELAGWVARAPGGLYRRARDGPHQGPKERPQERPG